MDQTIRRQQQKITLIKMINAWKQATTYLKKNKKHIKYAENPEITHPEINKYKQNKRKLIKEYKDEITIQGEHYDLNMEKPIEIKYAEKTKNPTRLPRHHQKTKKQT